MAEKLRVAWEKDEHSWGLRKLQREICEYHPDPSDQYVTYVKRLLNEGDPAKMLDDKQKTDLLQGLCECLRRRGWAVSLLLASGSTVLVQAVELAATKYNNAMRKKHGKSSGWVPFDIQKAYAKNRSRYPDADIDRQPIQYVMGWVLAPPGSLGTNLQYFVPVTAIDWASAVGEGQGSFVGRGVKDANGHILAPTFAHVLCAESNAGCTVFSQEETALHGKAAIDSTLNAPNHVHFTDGGVALAGCNQRAYPQAGAFLLDYKHTQKKLLRTKVGREFALPVYDRHIFTPKHLKHVLLADLAQLNRQCPAAYQLLKAAGFERLFPALLPPAAVPHGTITSNDIEQFFNMMLKAGVRCKRFGIDSMLAAVSVLMKNDERRCKSFKAVAKRYGGEHQAQPPRLLEALCAANDKLPTLKCLGSGTVPGVYVVSSSNYEHVLSPSSIHSSTQDNMTYDVVPSSVARHRWDEVCDCGMPYMSWASMCKHFLKVTTNHPTTFGVPSNNALQKPWTTMAGWRRQLQNVLDPPSGTLAEIPTWEEIISMTKYLRETGQLVRLQTPDIRISTGGNPSVKQVDTDCRVHSIIEDRNAASDTVTGDEFLGAVVGNVRGKPGRKEGIVHCGTCHKLGHTAANCPGSQQMLGQKPVEGTSSALLTPTSSATPSGYLVDHMRSTVERRQQIDSARLQRPATYQHFQSLMGASGMTPNPDLAAAYRVPMPPHMMKDMPPTLCPTGTSLMPEDLSSDGDDDGDRSHSLPVPTSMPPGSLPPSPPDTDDEEMGEESFSSGGTPWASSPAESPIYSPSTSGSDEWEYLAHAGNAVQIHKGELPPTVGQLADSDEGWYAAVVTEGIAWDSQEGVWTVQLQLLTTAGSENVTFWVDIHNTASVRHVWEWLRPYGTATASPLSIRNHIPPPPSPPPSAPLSPPDTDLDSDDSTPDNSTPDGGAGTVAPPPPEEIHKLECVREQHQRCCAAAARGDMHAELDSLIALMALYKGTSQEVFFARHIELLRSDLDTEDMIAPGDDDNDEMPTEFGIGSPQSAVPLTEYMGDEDLDYAFAEYTDDEEDGEGGDDDDEEDGEGGDDDDEEDGEGGDDDEQTVNYRELDEAFLSGDTDHTWYYGDESDEDGSHSSGPSILYHSEESSDSSEF